MTESFLKEIKTCSTRAALDELRTRITKSTLPDPGLTRVLDAVRSRWYALNESVPKMPKGAGK